MEKNELMGQLPNMKIEPIMPETLTLGTVIAEIMRPVMETLTKMLEQNTAALDQLAAAQSIQNDRMEALERQIRLNTPVSSKEAQYLNERARSRAYELLDKRGAGGDRKAVTRLANAIRKSLLARYGAGNVREIPKHEYSVAMHTIDLWNDALIVRDIAKEARERAEESIRGAFESVGLDGAAALAGEDHQPNQPDPAADGVTGGESA